MRHVRFDGVLLIVALGLLIAAPAQAQDNDVAVVLFVRADSSVAIPAGLRVACLKDPNSGERSPLCPVVVYQGITTWAYSYIDNRISMALVSYDSQHNVVRNVNHDGARYVWNMISSPHTKIVLVAGQANQNFAVPWSAFGKH